MTKPPDHYYPYFLVFLLHVKRVPRAVCSFLKSWLPDKVHIFWSEPISRRSISAGSRRAKSHLAGRSRSPRYARRTCWEGKSREQGREGQEPGIKRGRLIHTSRIAAGQTERSLSVADTTQLCSLSPPHSPPYCPSPLWAAREKTMELLSL